MEQPIAADIPATIPIHSAELSFAEQRALTKEGKEEIANPAAPKVEAKAEPAITPDAEADSQKPDAELSEAARTLRKHRATERKAKIQREIDEGIREREQTRADVVRERAELERLRAERAALTRGESPRRPATATAPGVADDPTDPEPQEGQYTDYGQYLREAAAWTARREVRTQQATARARSAQEQHNRALDTTIGAAREKFSDYDAVLQPVAERLSTDTARDADVTRFIAQSKVGGEVLYRLGKDAAALDAVLSARTPQDLYFELKTIEKSLTAPPAHKPVTSAPAPPTKTVGGSSTAAEPDENTMAFGEFRRRQIAKRREAAAR